jgi:hypothetical protein
MSEFVDFDLDDPAIAEKVFHAEFALISHGIGADPFFNYANQTVLNLFEINWEALLQMRSSESAELSLRSNRQRFMDRVATNGHVTGYNGIRISANGSRFKIKNVTIWNITDDNNQYVGQAAYFRDWEHLPH